MLSNKSKRIMLSNKSKRTPRKFQQIVITFSMLVLTLVIVGRASAADATALVSYWHVWTDSDATSHQTRCELHNFVLQSISPPVSPQWLDRMRAEGATVIVSVMPTGWVGTWHENPKPQWIIPLSGRWFVETMDGKRVEMGPGDISFGEDQNTRPDSKGHNGHLSGTVGHTPATLMIVQLKGKPTINEPCHFK